MNLKDFKQKLINYTRTQLPEEYSKVLRVPGMAATQGLNLRTTKKEEVKDFCRRTFGKETRSFKISRKESLNDEEILESFLVDLSRENEEITSLFPQYTEDEFLEIEKNRIRKNLKIAFNNSKSEVYAFLQKAEEAGLIIIATMNTKQQIWNDFLKAWPLEKVKAMKIEEYTNLKRNDSFCYWVEARTGVLGRISGGSAYKFGIFKIKNPEEDKRPGYESDGEYKWVGKFGKERDTAFNNIKAELITIIEAAQNDGLKEVENATLGHMYKWKVAALYNEGIPHIYSPKAVNYLIKYFGKSASEYAEKYKTLAAQKEPIEDIIKLSERLWNIYAKNNQETKEKELGEAKTSTIVSLNHILFGPPGTGKTYNAISEAIKIVNPDFYEKHYEDRDSLKEEFNRLLIKDWEETDGRIAFCTFHQSYTYEDFVEGIKPKTTDDDKKQVYYKIEDGIFKKICRLSRDAKKSRQIKRTKVLQLSEKDFEESQFYKLSLGKNDTEEDKEIYEYCKRNNVIALGHGDQNNFSNKTENQISEIIKKQQLSSYTSTAVNTFIHYMKNGNYVIISNGVGYVKALGKVAGDYFFIEDSPIGYSHFRRVNWIFTDEQIPASEIYQLNFQRKTIGKLEKRLINKEFFVTDEFPADGSAFSQEEVKENRYVLIIDEINRGNVSSIFGELVTLLEEDKRVDGDEPLEVVLPYSKEPFQVPSNIYVLGTMNTADRSIETLDTALRRRFSFDEIPPDYKVLGQEGSAIIADIDIVKMLKTINDRIELLIDKDHQIGHSYFIHLKSFDDLKRAFVNKVIPLLQEYFFGDIGKIGLVLGSAFIENKKEKVKLFDFKDYDSDLRDELNEKAIFHLKPSTDWEQQSFISIYV